MSDRELITEPFRLPAENKYDKPYQIEHSESSNVLDPLPCRSYSPAQQIPQRVGHLSTGGPRDGFRGERMIRTFAGRMGWLLVAVALGWLFVVIAVLGFAVRIVRRAGDLEPGAESDYSPDLGAGDSVGCRECPTDTPKLRAAGIQPSYS
jgi:hypothetical protein